MSSDGFEGRNAFGHLPLKWGGRRATSASTRVFDALSARLRASSTRYGRAGWGSKLRACLIPSPTLPFSRGGSAPPLRRLLRPKIIATLALHRNFHPHMVPMRIFFTPNPGGALHDRHR